MSGGRRRAGLVPGAVGALAAVAVLVSACAAHRPPAFDAARAFSLLEEQTRFGPRVPGTPAHERCAAFLADSLRPYATSVRAEPFTGTVAGEERPMSNIVARIVPGRPGARRVLLCAHWDSRPWADRDPDPARRREPIAGANDGASGVAVLLEVARSLTASPSRVGVDIALFDGEDLGSEGAPQLFSQGARAYVAAHRDSLPEIAILLDMVGDRTLTLPIEQNSWHAAPRVVRQLWAIGRKQAPGVWLDTPGYALTDDHGPLIEAGVEAVDVIDFDYPSWHTLADTPDKCSAASLEAVGRPLLLYLQSLRPESSRTP